MAKQYDTIFLAAFGKRLAQVRKEKGLTQEQLANATDLHRTYIGFIEQGSRNPSIDNVHKIAKSLHVKLSDLFEDDL